MGKRTNLNLNHLQAIMPYPEKSQFKGLTNDVLNLEEVAKNWINSQNKINYDDSIRLLKTHNILGKFKNYSFTDDKNTLATLHIVRDPRNVITSLKNHFNISNFEDAKKFFFKENQIITLSEQQKEKFLNKEKHPLPQIIGSWKTHYNSWKNMKKNYLLIKYENLLLNPKKEFRKITNYLQKLLNLKFSNTLINKAIELSSFKRLQTIEEETGFSESVLDPKSGRRKQFFHLGPKNDWHKILDRTISNEIEKEFYNEMSELGYL